MDEIGGQAEHAGDAAAPAPPAPHTVAIPASVSVTGRDESVELYPEVTMDIGIASMAAIRGALGEGQPAVEAALSRAFLRFGIESWTFRGRDGTPEPVTPEATARLLPFNGGGLLVAEAADALYGEAVTRPLVARLSALSPATPTAPSTPASRGSGPSSPTRSRRSSRTATAGKRSGARAR